MRHVPAWPRTSAAVFLAATALSPRNLARGKDGRPSMPPVSATDSDWPRAHSPMRRGPAAEAWIRRFVRGMSLEEKVGRKTQPEIQSITPEEVRHSA